MNRRNFMTLAAAAAGGGLLGVNVNDYPTPQDALDNEQHVYFPPGIYGPITVHPHQTVDGAGAGPVGSPSAGGTVFLSTDGTPAIQGDGSASLNNIILRDLSAVHQGAGPAAIDLPNLRSSTLHQVAVLSEQGDGLRILKVTTKPTWLNQFFGCEFRADQGYAFQFEGTDSSFHGCVVSGGPDKTGLGALDLGGGGNRYVGGQLFRSVAGGAALELRVGSSETKFTSVSSCYIDENNGYGIRVVDPQARGGPANVVITGCNFRGNPNGDLHLNGVGGVVITNNTFYFGLVRVRVSGQSLGSGIVFAKNLVKGTVSLPGVNVTDNAYV